MRRATGAVTSAAASDVVRQRLTCRDGARSGLRQVAHRRVQHRDPPEDVRERPRGGGPRPGHVVRGPRQPCRLVAEQLHRHAEDEQAEGGGPPRRRREEARIRAEQEDVHERVEAAEHDLPAERAVLVENGGHDEDPLEDGERERHDQPVGDRPDPPVAARRDDEHHRHRGEERVRGEVEAVGRRRRRPVRVDVGQHVPGDEERDAAGEDEPRQRGPWAVAAHGPDDRHERDAGEDLVQRVVQDGRRRHEEVPRSTRARPRTRPRRA